MARHVVALLGGRRSLREFERPKGSRAAALLSHEAAWFAAPLLVVGAAEFAFRAGVCTGAVPLKGQEVELLEVAWQVAATAVALTTAVALFVAESTMAASSTRNPVQQLRAAGVMQPALLGIGAVTSAGPAVLFRDGSLPESVRIALAVCLTCATLSTALVLYRGLAGVSPRTRWLLRRREVEKLLRAEIARGFRKRAARLILRERVQGLASIGELLPLPPQIASERLRRQVRAVEVLDIDLARLRQLIEESPRGLTLTYVPGELREANAPLLRDGFDAYQAGIDFAIEREVKYLDSWEGVLRDLEGELARLASSQSSWATGEVAAHLDDLLAGALELDAEFQRRLPQRDLVGSSSWAELPHSRVVAVVEDGVRAALIAGNDHCAREFVGPIYVLLMRAMELRHLGAVQDALKYMRSWIYLARRGDPGTGLQLLELGVSWPLEQVRLHVAHTLAMETDGGKFAFAAVAEVYRNVTEFQRALVDMERWDEFAENDIQWRTVLEHVKDTLPYDEFELTDGVESGWVSIAPSERDRLLAIHAGLDGLAKLADRLRMDLLAWALGPDGRPSSARAALALEGLVRGLSSTAAAIETASASENGSGPLWRWLADKQSPNQVFTIDDVRYRRNAHAFMLAVRFPGDRSLGSIRRGDVGVLSDVASRVDSLLAAAPALKTGWDLLGLSPAVELVDEWNRSVREGELAALKEGSPPEPLSDTRVHKAQDAAYGAWEKARQRGLHLRVPQFECQDPDHRIGNKSLNDRRFWMDTAGHGESIGMVSRLGDLIGVHEVGLVMSALAVGAKRRRSAGSLVDRVRDLRDRLVDDHCVPSLVIVPHSREVRADLRRAATSDVGVVFGGGLTGVAGAIDGMAVMVSPAVDGRRLIVADVGRAIRVCEAHEHGTPPGPVVVVRELEESEVRRMLEESSPGEDAEMAEARVRCQVVVDISKHFRAEGTGVGAYTCTLPPSGRSNAPP